MDAASVKGPGTKVCAWYQLELAAEASRTIHLRLYEDSKPAPDFDATFTQRSSEADEFYSLALAPRDVR